jgi:DNA-binding NtrC family response regulator
MPRGRVLVVDDEEPIRTLLFNLLTNHDYEVETAGDGEEALQKYAQGRFDVVVSDLVMPKMDGLRLLKEIKIKDPRAIFLVITGFPSVETGVEAMKAGAYDYIIKPFSLADLQAKIDRALERRRLGQELRTMTGLVWALVISIPIWLVLGIIIAFLWR